MEDMLARHGDLDAVFSTSDSQSIGSVKALEAAKQDPLVVSFDAQPAIVKDIQSGTVVDASVAWSAHQLGADAVKAAVAAARKQPVERKTLVPVTVVSAENAAAWEG
jgi:ribose transport system substrate-binding protein